YFFAAERAARQATKTHGVEEIHLFGGMMRRCVPGISDLDFIIVDSRGGLCLASLIDDLRRHVLRLRRVIPMIGEVQLVSPRVWTGTPFVPLKRLFFSPSLKWTSHGWERAEALGESGGVPAGFRLLSCGETYLTVQECLRRILFAERHRRYHRAGFQRGVRR